MNPALKDSGRRAGQYIGLTETPLKTQDEESRVKSEFDSGGRIKASVPLTAAVSEDRASPCVYMHSSSATVSPPMRCVARSSAPISIKHILTASRAEIPMVIPLSLIHISEP